MKKYLTYCLSIALLLVLGACEKEADNITLPNEPPKLVIYSYISPTDSLIVVNVTKSAPFFGDNNSDDIYTPVENATVTISSNGFSLPLPYDGLNQRYMAPNNVGFSITEGESYTLSVTAPGGFSCTAKTTIPSSQPTSFRVEIDSTIRNGNGFQEKQYRIRGRWNDLASANNYYHYSTTISSDSKGNGGFDICNEFKTDEGKNGTEISESCTYTNFFDPNFPNSSSVSGNVFLLTTDFAYYRYHESLYRYDNENPFAEPTRIYSNIEGGLGCFGSYLKQRVFF